MKLLFQREAYYVFVIMLLYLSIRFKYGINIVYIWLHSDFVTLTSSCYHIRSRPNVWPWSPNRILNFGQF